MSLAKAVLSGTVYRNPEKRFTGNNIPVTYEKCVEKGWYPPTVGWWHEMNPDTLKKCEWEYVDEQ